MDSQITPTSGGGTCEARSGPLRREFGADAVDFLREQRPRFLESHQRVSPDAGEIHAAVKLQVLEKVQLTGDQHLLPPEGRSCGPVWAGAGGATPTGAPLGPPSADSSNSG